MIKNAIAYLVTPGFRIDPEMLQRVPARACGPTEHRTVGFTAPCDHSTANLVHHVSGHALIAVETEERILPGSVVADEVEDRAQALESRQGFKPGRKQMRELKERVTEELLPKAFTQRRRTLAFFSGNYLVIDTSSPARAELVIETLRRALDQFPLLPINTKKRINGEMIQWLLGYRPHFLSVDDFVELERAEPGKPAIAYKRTTLDESDMRRRIQDAYVPRKIGITYADRLSFKIDENLHLKQIVALDLLNAESAKTREDAEDCAAAFDADVTIMVGEVVRALDFLIDELGGLVEQDPDLLTASDSPARPEDSADELYMQAAALVVENGKPSISHIQRHLRIEYNRAARLIEDMEHAGIVSVMDSTGARKVLITKQSSMGEQAA